MKTTQSLRAGTVALALAASAVTVPTAIAAETEGVPAIESGAVNWPIKESFNKYVVGMISQGEITTDGVNPDDNNSFDFTVNPDESELDADGNGTLQLDGSIHYEGHHGALDLKYSDIKINIENGTEATITADYHLQGGFPGQEVHNDEVNDAEISSFDLGEALVPEANKTLERTDLTTTLLQGAQDSLLNYDAGTVLDDGDVDVFVTFGEAPAEQPAGDDDDAKDNDNPADGDEDQDDKDKQEDPKTDPAKDLSSKDGSSKGGTIAIIVAILAAIGAAVGGFIPGINLKNFGF